MEYKQAIIIRTDLRMGKGKIAAQASHASLSAAFKTLKKKEKKFNEWFASMAKIVLKVDSERELMKYAERAGRAGIMTSIIRDAGRTQIPAGTITALGIGPDEETKIDKIVKDLKLL